MRTIALIVALAACSPSYRIVRGRCPTLATLMTDFAIGGVGLGVSVDRYNAGDYALAGTAFAAAMAVGLAANLSECR